jgi:hypothetical protein
MYAWRNNSSALLRMFSNLENHKIVLGVKYVSFISTGLVRNMFQLRSGCSQIVILVLM